jgi:hypothetical protein
MHWLMLQSSRRWVCALSGSVRGRISELMLSKGAVGLPVEHEKRPHPTIIPAFMVGAGLCATNSCSIWA